LAEGKSASLHPPERFDQQHGGGHAPAEDLDRRDLVRQRDRLGS